MSKHQTTAFAIGRWMPIHLGHKEFLVKLAKSFDRLVIGIGSCYENGTPRNCIPAIEREKLLRKMLKTEGITNTIIIPVQDRPTFEEWIKDVCAVCEKFNVTHFCTGNKEDILDVMDNMGIKLDVEMINPETDSSFPFHATDIRNAILNKEWDKLDNMIPIEIKPMVLKQISKEIKLASLGMGQEFIPGRQTVDLVFIVKNKSDNKHYVLIGKRNASKIDFPNTWAISGGGIDEFESPIDALTKCFAKETGIKISVLDNSDEPAKVRIDNLDGREAELHFTGIYASADEKINGTRGGGSQCFAMVIEDKIENISKILNSTHDMDELKFIDVDELHKIMLAFDQKKMVYNALTHLAIPYDNGELLQCFNEKGEAISQGVSREKAHKDGILHGASHMYICRRKEGKLQILLQRRSANKDSYPNCLDISSAGHIELGSDFISTAIKELNEELGIEAEKNDLIELFTQIVEHKDEFYNKSFIDKEINKVYLYNRPVDASKLQLQREEVSEVVWLDANEIIERLKENDGELCLVLEELQRVIEQIKNYTMPDESETTQG